jgi:hypothetical protein
VTCGLQAFRQAFDLLYALLEGRGVHAGEGGMGGREGGREGGMDGWMDGWIKITKRDAVKVWMIRARVFSKIFFKN